MGKSHRREKYFRWKHVMVMGKYCILLATCWRGAAGKHKSLTEKMTLTATALSPSARKAELRQKAEINFVDGVGGGVPRKCIIGRFSVGAKESLSEVKGAVTQLQ